MTPLTLIILAALYTIAGAVCLIWPRRLQSLVLKQGANARASYTFLLNFVRSNWYVRTLRVIGVVSAVAAILLLDTASRVRVTITFPQSYIQTVPQRYIQVSTILHRI
jgi:hypothetical protein